MPIKAKVAKETEVPEFEPGVYALALVEVKEKPDNTYNGEPRPQIQFIFKSDSGLRVDHYTSTSWFEGNDRFSPSKLYSLMTKFGIEAEEVEVEGEEGPEFDVVVPVERAVGTRISAFIDKKASGWPEIKSIIKVLSGPDEPLTAAEVASRLGAQA